MTKQVTITSDVANMVSQGENLIFSKGLGITFEQTLNQALDELLLFWFFSFSTDSRLISSHMVS